LKQGGSDVAKVHTTETLSAPKQISETKWAGSKKARPGALPEIALGDKDVTGLIRDAIQPAADCRVAVEIEIPLLGDMGLGIERDIGD
jgi:hypothetical protein